MRPSADNQLGKLYDHKFDKLLRLLDATTEGSGHAMSYHIALTYLGAMREVDHITDVRGKGTGLSGHIGADALAELKHVHNEHVDNVEKMQAVANKVEGADENTIREFKTRHIVSLLLHAQRKARGGPR